MTKGQKILIGVLILSSAVTAAAADYAADDDDAVATANTPTAVKPCAVESLAVKYLSRYLSWCHITSEAGDGDSKNPTIVEEIEVIIVGFPGLEYTHNVVKGLKSMNYAAIHSDLEFPVYSDLTKLFAGGKDNELMDEIVKLGYTITAGAELSALWYEQTERFTNAKIILITPDSDEEWWDQWADWHAAISPFYGWPLTMYVESPNRAKGSDKKATERIGRNLFNDASSECLNPEKTNTLDLDLKRSCMKAMRAFNQKVADAVSKERLLVLQPSTTSYEALCGFLGTDNCPASDFPNTDETLAVWMGIRVISLLALLGPVFIFTFLYTYAVPKLFAAIFQPVLRASIDRDSFQGKSAADEFKWKSERGDYSSDSSGLTKRRQQR